MKKLIFPMVLLGLVLAFSGCKKNMEPAVSGSQIEVAVTYDEQYGILNAANLPVTIKNSQDGRVFTIETNAEGKAAFKDIPAGLYSVSCIKEMNAEEYQTATGLVANGKVIFSAALANVMLKPGANEGLSLTLKSTTSDHFVIKQIYYAGSNSKDAAGYRDQFIEIYNNSSDTLFADSLVICLVEGGRQFPPNLDQKFYYQESGSNPHQFDWLRTEGMPQNIDANNKFIYGTSYMIPGSGTTYAVPPGHSIVVAQSATNFKAPFTSTDGKEIKPAKPELTVDLSRADFEYNFGQVRPGWDVDNPSVPDLLIFARANSRDMILDTYGKEAIALWKYPGGPEKLPKYRRPYKEQYWHVEGPEYFRSQIPLEYIIDAVEIMAVPEPKRIPEKYDATFTFAKAENGQNAGMYSSLSVIRKTLRITSGGRKVLQDTNNSQNDFVTIKAEPHAFAQ